jgi:hypothetical protein
MVAAVALEQYSLLSVRSSARSLEGPTLDASLEFHCELGTQHDRNVENVYNRRPPRSVHIAHRVKRNVRCLSWLQVLSLHNFGSKESALVCQLLDVFIWVIK